MNTDFTEVMSKRTDEELIKIVSIKKEDYQPEAVEAAKSELNKRQVNPDKIEKVKLELAKQEKNKNEIESNKVTSWIRLIHFFIDLIGFYFIAFILSLFIDLLFPSSGQIMVGVLGYVFLLATFFLYYVFSEYKYQKTIGKLLTKTKVVMNDGRKPELNEIFIRTACRLIPFDRLSFLFARSGFHDYLSNTMVIKDETVKTIVNNH